MLTEGYIAVVHLLTANSVAESSIKKKKNQNEAK